MELICPAGTPVAFRDAVDAGADAVQCGFADETNAGLFLTLHFTRDELADAITYAHAHDARVVVAIDSYMRAGAEALWMQAVDDAVALGADAILVADIGLLAYVADKYPAQRRHLVLQLASASAAHIEFLSEAFGIRRAVLPRGLLVEEVLQIADEVECEIEVASGFVSQRRTGMEDQTGPSLDMLAHLDALSAAGITAIKVEDAPRGSAYIRSLLARMEAVDGRSEQAA